MAEHLIHFILNDVSEPLAAVRTNDDPDTILKAFRAHVSSGKPKSLDVNLLDSSGAYSDTLVIRLAQVAAISVQRNLRVDAVKLTVTTSTEKTAPVKKKAARKTAGKKKA
jgi:hypothetical protein